MEPFMALTEEDKQDICTFLLRYGMVDIPTKNRDDQLYKILSYWNFCKKDIFNCIFGTKLRVTFNTHINICVEEVFEKFKSYYGVPGQYIIDTCLRNDPDVFLQTNFVSQNGVFVAKVLNYIGMRNVSYRTKAALATAFHDLISFKNVYNNSIEDEIVYPFFNTKKKEWVDCHVPSGSKTIGQIGKFLKRIGFSDLSMFQEWKDEISMCTTFKEKDVTVTLSIHPIDFMTMSMNDCGWRSCLSWDGGCYPSGTISMMNSDNVILCYIQDTKKPYMFGTNIPNKAWRSLMVINDSCILGGKGYPYNDNAIIREAIKYLTKPCSEYFCHTYQEVSNYDDMQFISQHFSTVIEQEELYDLTEDVFIDEGDENHDQRILIYTGKYMYNDFFEDLFTHYLISKSSCLDHLTILDISGAYTCIACGEEIFDGDCGTLCCRDCHNISDSMGIIHTDQIVDSYCA